MNYTGTCCVMLLLLVGCASKLPTGPKPPTITIDSSEQRMALAKEANEIIFDCIRQPDELWKKNHCSARKALIMKQFKQLDIDEKQ